MTGTTLLDYTILITDKNLSVVGDPITVWESIDATLKFNEPDSSMFVVPAYDWIIAQVVAGNRCVLIRNGVILTAGPIEHWLRETSDDGENAGIGKLTIYFTSDLVWPAGRATYPDPAHTPDAQTVDNWTYTGNAETAIRTVVNLNAGPGALTARQVPMLALGTAAGVGTSVTVTADRMQPLMDLVRRIAELGGKLGVRTRQVGTQILFEVYAPQDKSGSVRFSKGLGNLRYAGYEVTAPSCTAAIVGGQGSGADSYMIERLNSTETATWGRFEKLVARPGTSTVQSLQDDGDSALAEGAATTRLAANTFDSPDQKFGVHYNVGDIVAVEAFPGQSFVDIIRTVHLQVYATAGEVVAATVGSQAASTDPMWVQRMREIDARVGKLERTVTPA
jgi:hypothetical protein